MPYDPNRHHRQSIRLRGYDYAQAGAYFVTICTYERRQLFKDPALCVIAEEQWRALDRAGARGDRSGCVSVDTWVVMPDHVHGIIVIGGGDDADDGAPHKSGANVASGSLGAIVRSYKAAVARRINALRRSHVALVWQRGYYEHIVRDDWAFDQLRHYIVTNPARLVEDPGNIDALLARRE